MTTNNLQEITERAEKLRQQKGYCPFQRTHGGIYYCTLLKPTTEHPHDYCEHLSRETVVIEESGRTGNLEIQTYYKSNFVSKGPADSE